MNWLKNDVLRTAGYLISINLDDSLGEVNTAWYSWENNME